MTTNNAKGYSWKEKKAADKLGSLLLQITKVKLRTWSTPEASGKPM